MELASVLYKMNIALMMVGLSFSVALAARRNLFLFANSLSLMMLVAITAGHGSKTVNYLSLMDGGEIMPGITGIGCSCGKAWGDA